MIALPNESSNAGVETRVLLAECRGPAARDYTFAAATEAMQLMDVILRNRLKNPGPFLARGATDIAGIVRAHGQFAGFETYPKYSAMIRANIQDALNIANDPKDSRSGTYAEFINKAIEIAKSVRYTDPSPGTLVAWRTSGSASPGRAFKFYKKVLGNDFYYQ